MNKLIITLCTLGFALTGPLALGATPASTPSTSIQQESATTPLKRFKDMSHEERQAYRLKVKQKWDSLTPAEQAAFKEKVKDKLVNVQKKQEDRAVLRLYGKEMFKQEQH